MILRDQLNRSIHLENIPQRIISLVPSLTELLCDLGLEDKLVGVTKFCIHPKYVKTKVQVIGGTKKLKLEKIKKLQPELIIANKEENERNQVETLAESFPVYISDIQTHVDTKNLIETIGKLFHCEENSRQIIGQLHNILASISRSDSDSVKPSVIYLIWQNPFMAAGGDTYISYMLDQMGFQNYFGEKERYPEITIDEIKAAAVDYVFLSSEPYPFKEQHISKIEGLSNTKCILVDGEFFSWYGSRIIHMEDYPSQLTSQL